MILRLNTIIIFTVFPNVIKKSMKTIFADTFYWVALINDRDDWHEQVVLKGI